jgi:phosphoribosylformimino-5-aminoimidazole carboxamide ribonucleotide (ProFAR) isomerase
MLLIIPKVELSEGKCQKCIIGETGTEDYYHNLSSLPVNLCILLRKENSKALFIIDSDSFDDKDNEINKNTIIEISKNVEIPLIVYSNFKSIEDCCFFLDNNIKRIVVGDSFFKFQPEIKQLISKYTASGLVYYYDNDKLNLGNNESDFHEFKNKMNELKSLGFNRIIYKDKNIIDIDNINSKYLKERANISGFKFTIDANLFNINQLLELQKLIEYKIDSLIIGDSFYTNKFPCQHIWRLAEKSI